MGSPLAGIDVNGLSDDELVKLYLQVTAGDEARGILPIDLEIIRENSIDSPFALATEVVDDWYKANLTERHRQMLDEVLAPWCLGETIKLDGVTYEPKEYTGLLILWSRSTIKSTMLRLLSIWHSIHSKLRKQEDSRQMFVHQVLNKALEHSESIREIARKGEKFRRLFPGFAPPKDLRDWDRIQQWRWPCFTSYAAQEFSYTFYGETSSKTGGHYTLRLVDDWVTEESVTNPDQLGHSERRFRGMDNLRDRTRPYNPWIAAGTNYHFHDTYARLERGGGWLVHKMPAHTGSAKAIFDLAALDDRDPKQRKLIQEGLTKLETERAGDLNFPTILPWRELYRSAVSQKSEDGLGGGHHEYNTQILLNPVPEDEQRFNQEDLDAAWEDDLPDPDCMNIFIRCDPAISEKRESDELAINVGGVDWKGHRWYLDGWAGREKKPTEQVRKMFRLARKWMSFGYSVKNIGVESVAYQEALAQICRLGVPSREPEWDGEMIPMLMSPCPVVSITRSSDMRKNERILQMTGPVERREVHIWKDNPIGRKLYDEHKNFPFGTKNILDTCHDLWIRTPKPARPMVDSKRFMDPQVKKFLKRAMLRADERPKPAGMSNVVALEGWGRR